MAAKQIEQKYKSSKQSKNSRGQSRKKHQSDMNNGVHMNGYKGQLDPRLGSHTISSTKYVNDYTTKHIKQDKKSNKQKRDDVNGNIITRDNVMRDSYDGSGYDMSGDNGERIGRR